MAFDYSTANTGKFTQIGKIIKYINSYLAQATTTMPAELKAIADHYEAADQTLQIEGLYSSYEGFKSGVVGTRQRLASFIDRTLLDRDTVLTQLPGPPQADVTSVLLALFQQMIADGKTVEDSLVTIGSTTAGTNSGNGCILVSKILDGFNPPLRGGVANIRYNTLASQLAVPSETMRWTCVADSMRDGVTEGAEQFSWDGGIEGQQLDYLTEGSGQGPGLTVANGLSALIADGAFENWSTNTPSNWTLVGSTVAGTHVFKESTNFYRGTYALKFLGTGALATMGVSQAVSPSRLKSRRRYLVAVRIKAASVPAAGQIEVHFSGTGYTKTAPTNEVQDVQISGTPTGGDYTLSYTGAHGGTQTTAAIAFNATSATVQAALRLLAGLESVVVATQAGAPPDVTHRVTFHGVPGDQSLLVATIAGLTGGTPAQSVAQVTAGVEGDCIVLAAAAFPTTYCLRYFWINTPAIIPSDWTIVAQITGTLTNTVAVYVDDLVLAEPIYHGGVCAVPLAGSTRFVVGDTFTMTVANDQDGIIQDFFRAYFKFQLASSGSPNISDSLAS